MLAHSLFFLLSIVLARSQSIVYDGRVPETAVAADFDAATSLFDPEFTKGQSTLVLCGYVICKLICIDVTFSQLLRFPGDQSLV